MKQEKLYVIEEKTYEAHIDEEVHLYGLLHQLAFLAGKIKENIFGRQWLCGFPEKLVILTVGDYIVSVFGAAELTDPFIAKLSAEYSSTKQIFDVPIAS